MNDEHIGPYRLLSRLGTGDVHRAAGPTGRDVAIRLLPADSRDRLRADLDRMRAVRSPYVVDVLDGDPEAPRPYVVSRFVPGHPLDRHVAAHGPLTGQALDRLALDLAKALAAIHESGLAHRALRPQDVLIVDGSPVIVDFALAPPADPAADLGSWAALVAHAAGGAIPSRLQPLLEAATTSDEKSRPTAHALVEALTRLAPPPATPRSNAGALAMESATASGSANAPSAVLAPPGGGSGTAPSGVAVGVVQAWARLLAALAVVAVAAVTVMMPVVGTAGSVVAVVVLRGVAGRGWGMAVGRTAVTLVCAGVVALMVTLGLASLSAVGVEADPLGACALGLGAGVAVLWTAPGVSGPREGLERLAAGVAGTPRAIGIGGVLLGIVAFLSVVGAISLTPSFAPMYGLQSSLESAVSQVQTRLQ